MPAKLTKSQLRRQLIPLHVFTEDTSRNVPELRSFCYDLLEDGIKGAENFCMWYDSIVHGLRYLNAQFKAAGMEPLDDFEWAHISPYYEEKEPQFDSPEHAGNVIESRLKLFAGFFDFCKSKMAEDTEED